MFVLTGGGGGGAERSPCTTSAHTYALIPAYLGALHTTIAHTSGKSDICLTLAASTARHARLHAALAIGLLDLPEFTRVTFSLPSGPSTNPPGNRGAGA